MWKKKFRRAVWWLSCVVRRIWMRGSSGLRLLRGFCGSIWGEGEEGAWERKVRPLIVIQLSFFFPLRRLFFASYKPPFIYGQFLFFFFFFSSTRIWPTTKSHTYDFSLTLPPPQTLYPTLHLPPPHGNITYTLSATLSSRSCVDLSVEREVGVRWGVGGEREEVRMECTNLRMDGGMCFCLWCVFCLSVFFFFFLPLGRGWVCV